MYRLFLLLLFCSALNSAAIAQTAGNVWIVAVGIGVYQHDDIMTRLDFTIQGAYEFTRIFEGRQLSDAKAPVLTNQKARRTDIINAMESTFVNNPRVKPEDIVLFYFSGHGEIAGGKAGICPYDYAGDVRGLITDEDIQAIMRRSPARHKACFIEACKTEAQSAAIFDPTILESFNKQRSNIGGGLVYMTSTRTGEKSWGRPDIGGYFTHYLLRGLEGEANGNNDAYITVDELFAFVKNGVSSYSQGKQVPQINDRRGYDPALPVMVIPEKLPPPKPDPFSEYPKGFEYLTDQMAFIRGGSFQMGSEEGDADEKPVHSVKVRDFYLSRYEVTVAQFAAFIEDTRYETDAEKEGFSYYWDGDSWEKKDGVYWRCDTEGNIRPVSEWNHPVIHVSWNDATEYCKWLSRKTGKTFRLPTEAEWEYAAGNGSKHTKYSWGNSAPSGKNGGSVADETGAKKYNWTRSETNIFLNYTDGYASTAPAGQFNSNDFGLYDMTGNVWEWCQDVWHSSYEGAPADGSAWTSGGDQARRVVRGGSWYYFPSLCRVARRCWFEASLRSGNVGFRLAR
jgi:formylglycine-generating enzyme required for sulfatase activity